MAWADEINEDDPETPEWVREHLHSAGVSRWRFTPLRIRDEHPVIRQGWMCERCGSDLKSGDLILLTRDSRGDWGAKHHRCPRREEKIFERP